MDTANGDGALHHNLLAYWKARAHEASTNLTAVLCRVSRTRDARLEGRQTPLRLNPSLGLLIAQRDATRAWIGAIPAEVPVSMTNVSPHQSRLHMPDGGQAAGTDERPCMASPRRFHDGNNISLARGGQGPEWELVRTRAAMAARTWQALAYHKCYLSLQSSPARTGECRQASDSCLKCPISCNASTSTEIFPQALTALQSACLLPMASLYCAGLQTFLAVVSAGPILRTAKKVAADSAVVQRAHSNSVASHLADAIAAHPPRVQLNIHVVEVDSTLLALVSADGQAQLCDFFYLAGWRWSPTCEAGHGPWWGLAPSIYSTP